MVLPCAAWRGPHVIINAKGRITPGAPQWSESDLNYAILVALSLTNYRDLILYPPPLRLLDAGGETDILATRKATRLDRGGVTFGWY